MEENNYLQYAISAFVTTFTDKLYVDGKKTIKEAYSNLKVFLGNDVKIYLQNEGKKWNILKVFYKQNL